MFLTEDSRLSFNCPACFADNYASPSQAMLEMDAKTASGKCEDCGEKLWLTLNGDGETMEAELYAAHKARESDYE